MAEQGGLGATVKICETSRVTGSCLVKVSLSLLTLFPVIKLRYIPALKQQVNVKCYILRWELEGVLFLILG